MTQPRARHPYIPDHDPELRMVWQVSPPPPVPQLPPGYVLRPVRRDEHQAYEALSVLAWPLQYSFQETFDIAVPDGFFAIEHIESGDLVSSCIAVKPGVFKEYPDVGTLGWLVTDPAHGGTGLATGVVAAVMNRLAAEGYPRSYLGTEDERLAAIHIYLKYGWQPLLYTEGMEERWRAIFAALDRRNQDVSGKNPS